MSLSDANRKFDASALFAGRHVALRSAIQCEDGVRRCTKSFAIIGQAGVAGQQRPPRSAGEKQHAKKF